MCAIRDRLRDEFTQYKVLYKCSVYFTLNLYRDKLPFACPICQNHPSWFSKSTFSHRLYFISHTNLSCLQWFGNVGWELVSWSLTSLFSTNMAISETMLVGSQEASPACKKTWWSAGVVTCLQRGANDLHMVPVICLPHKSLLQYQPTLLIKRNSDVLVFEIV